MYEGTLCTCGEPRELAWHSHSEGEYEGDPFVCHACSAREGSQRVLTRLSVRPPAKRTAAYPPFDIAKTITPPDPAPKGAV